LPSYWPSHMGRPLTRVVAPPYVRGSLRLVHITVRELPMLAGHVHTTCPRGRIYVASEWPVDTHGAMPTGVGHSLHSQCSHVSQVPVPYGTGMFHVKHRCRGMAPLGGVAPRQTPTYRHESNPPIGTHTRARMCVFVISSRAGTFHVKHEHLFDMGTPVR